MRPGIVGVGYELADVDKLTYPWWLFPRFTPPKNKHCKQE